MLSASEYETALAQAQGYAEHGAMLADYARSIGVTLCIMNPYNNRERWQTCCRIIDNHPSTTVDNRAYLLVFNNHLPKQRFCL